VRDALKVLDAFENPENAAKTEQEKLRDIDERYPMTHPAQTSDRMTPNNRRVLLEAIAIYALAQLSRANPAAPILQNWSGPWMFLEWANQHVITAAEDKAQLEAHQIGRSMPWELVPDATTMDFRIAPDRDGTGEISDLIGLLRDELGEDEDLSDVSRQEAEDIADAATAPEPEEGSPGFLQYFNFSGELGMTEGVELTKKRAIRQSRASNPSMKPRHFRYEREGSGWRWQIKPPILRVVDLQRATGLTEAQRDAAGPQEDQTERSIGSNGNRSSNSPTD
jgi:hypothetical protein